MSRGGGEWCPTCEAAAPSATTTTTGTRTVTRPTPTLSRGALALALATVTMTVIRPAQPGGLVGASPSGTVEFYLSGVRWQQLYDHNTGKYYFSDTSNAHTQWEDPRMAGQAAGGLGGGLVATLALAPIAFLGVAMFVRVMYLQAFHPEYLYPKRYRKSRKRGWARSKVRAQRALPASAILHQHLRTPTPHTTRYRRVCIRRLELSRV